MQFFFSGMYFCHSISWVFCEYMFIFSSVYAGNMLQQIIPLFLKGKNFTSFILISLTKKPPFNHWSGQTVRIET